MLSETMNNGKMAFGRIKLLVLTGCMLLTACGQNKPTKRALLEREGIGAGFRKVFEENCLMGMSVLFIYDGNTLWEGYYGMADSARQIPISDRTMYRVASISKMFTATALLQLWEAGRVNLDTDVSQYLGWPLQHPKHPEIPITLRHLMSHTSGIRDCDAYYNFSANMIPEKLDIRELFLSSGKYFDDDLFAEHAPGEYFSYANCTWGLVATIVEKVSGERFDDYCRQHVLQPLGMQADFNVDKIESMDDIAVLYRFLDGKWTPQADDYQGIRPASRAFVGYQPGQNGLIFGPQGSLRSSAQDLARMAYMLMNDGTWNDHRILEKETVNMMLDKQWTYDGNNGNTGDDLFHSYGFAIHRTLPPDSADMVFPDRKMLGHMGDAYGLLSGMYFNKKTKSGIIFLTNGGKQIYHKGAKTSFYKIEEDVYSTAYQFHEKICHD
jgi:CubicO group peptidase (beta-lactamase class C family)